MKDIATNTYQDWDFVLLSPWGTVGLVSASVIVVLALALTAWGYRHHQRPLIRALLLTLRVLALSAVLLLVLQPAIQLRSVTRIPNHVVLMTDVSRSMAVREERGGPSRIERAAALLARSEDRLRSWRRERFVDRLTFGSQVGTLGARGAEALEADEPATLTRDALARVQQLYRDKDLAAVVLISDGIDNGRFGLEALSEESLRFLRSLEAPVHTVWVGAEEIRDVAVAEIFSDDFAFVRNAVRVEADVVVSGMDLERVPVTLETGGSVVGQREIVLERGKSRYRVRFEFVPQRVGKYVYSVTTPLHEGEALESNNRRSFVLKVIRDRIRVLQLSGRPSWDERFLRRLLKRDPNVDLISFFILRTPTDLALGPNSELSLIPFPTEELFERELGSFDLIILQDFNYKPYGIGMYLPHIRRFVLDGGGLAMIGGSQSFSSGGYHRTPVGEVLPVRLPPPSGAARLLSVEEFQPRITAAGEDHPILQVGRTQEESRKLLRSLPPLAGANLVAGLRPRATSLAVHPTLRTRDGEPMPVLAVSEVREGRSMAITTDTLWSWAFHAVGAGGTRQAYDRFWRNAIRWLIRDPELRYLRVIPKQDEVRLGSPAAVTVRAYNPDYQPAQGLKVAYRVSRVGGKRGDEHEGRTDSTGQLGIELEPTEVGAYSVEATATIGGRKTVETGLFLVEPTGAEDRDARATPVLLEQIAAATGGRYLGRAGALPDLELREPRLVRVNWRRDVELWSRWWSLVACILLLGLEWGLRRRFGYL